MTISSDKNRWSYVGDGATTSFDYGNKIFAETDLEVYIDGVLQTVNTDYTVSGVGGEAGGTVALAVTPKAAATIIVVRDVPKTQGTDLPIGGVFPAVAVEDVFDKITVLAQQNADKVARALVVGDSDPNAFGAMPALSTFFGKYLGFDGTGVPTPGVSVGTLAVTYTADTFSGDNSTLAFTLTAAPASTQAAAVFISGVRQVPVTDYSVSGTTLTFVSAPPTGTNNIFVLASQSFAGVPSDGSVTAAKIAAGAVLEAGIGADAVNWLTKVKKATAGDLPVFDASGDPALLAKGTALQQLRMNAGATALEYFTQTAAVFSKSFTSTEQTITTGGTLTLAHSLGVMPKLIQSRLVCKTAENGYSIGDEVITPSGHQMTIQRQFSIALDATNLTILFGTDATAIIRVLHKSTHASSNITNANWKLVVRAWA